METANQLNSQPQGNVKLNLGGQKDDDLTSEDEDMVNNNPTTKDGKIVQSQNSQITTKSTDGISSLPSQYDPSKSTQQYSAASQQYSTASQQYSTASQQYSPSSTANSQQGSTFNGSFTTNTNYQQQPNVNANTYGNLGQGNGNWNPTNQGTTSYSNATPSANVNQQYSNAQMNALNRQNNTYTSAASGGMQASNPSSLASGGMQKNPSSFSYSNTSFSADISQMINSSQNYSTDRQANVSSSMSTNGFQKNPSSYSYSNSSLSSGYNQMSSNGQSNTMSFQNTTATSTAMGGMEKKQKTGELENNSVTAIAAMNDSQMLQSVPKSSIQNSQIIGTLSMDQNKTSSFSNSNASMSNNSITMPGSNFVGTQPQSTGGQSSNYGGNYQLNSTSGNYQVNSTSGSNQLSPKSANYQTGSSNGNYQLSPTNASYKPAQTNGNYFQSPTSGNYQMSSNNGNLNLSPSSLAIKIEKESPKNEKKVLNGGGSFSTNFTDQFSNGSFVPDDKNSVAKLYEMYQSSLAHISELRTINEKMSKENSELTKQGGGFKEIKLENGLAIQDNDPLAVKKLKKLLENSICTNAANKVHLLAMEEKLKANTGQHGNVPAGGGAFDPNTMRKMNEMTEKMRKAIMEINQLKMVNDRISKENEKLMKEEGKVSEASKINKDKEQKYMEIEMRHVELKEVNKRLVENLKNSLDRIKKMKAESSRQVESKSSILLRKLSCVLIAQLNPSLSREGILHFLGSSENISTFLNRQPEEQRKLFESIPLFQKFKDFSSEDENIAKNMTNAFDSEDDGGAMIKLLKEGSGGGTDQAGKPAEGGSNSSTRCALCPMKWKGKFMKTSPPFLMHLLDKHFKKLFDAIPNDAKEYTCEYEPCGYVTPLRFGLIYHLSSRHMELEKLLKKEKMDPNVLFPVWGEKKEAPKEQANANAKTTPSASGKGANPGQPVTLESTSDEEGTGATKIVKKELNQRRTDSAEANNKNFGMVKYGKDKMSPNSRPGQSNAGRPGQGSAGSGRKVEELVCTPNVQDMTSDDEIKIC